MLSAAGWVLYGHLAAQRLHAFRHARPRLYGVVDVDKKQLFEVLLSDYLELNFSGPGVRFAAEDFEDVIRHMRRNLAAMKHRESRFYQDAFTDGVSTAIAHTFAEFGVISHEVYLLLTADDKGVSE